MEDKNQEVIGTPPSITLESADSATFKWVNEDVSISTLTNSGFVKVPVKWVASEKALQSKGDPSLRDTSGALILPLITIERISVARDPSRKGPRWANLPYRPDDKMGTVTVSTRIKQDKTANYSNAHAKAKMGKLNFRTRKQEKVIYETFTIPAPTYVEATYKISLRSEYQQQMNDMVQPFITLVGSSNYLTLRDNGVSFEAFVQQDISMENTVSDMESERRYESFLELKVIVPLTGQGTNQDTPKYVRSESAIDVKIARERTILDPSSEPNN